MDNIILQEILNLNPNKERNEYVMISKRYDDPAQVYFLSYYDLHEIAEGWEHFQFYQSDEFETDKIYMEFLNKNPDEDYKYFKITEQEAQ